LQRGTKLSASLAANNRALPITTIAGLMSNPTEENPSFEEAYVVVPLPFQGSKINESEERPHVESIREAKDSGKPA
jgi:hypothetical protein